MVHIPNTGKREPITSSADAVRFAASQGILDDTDPKEAAASPEAILLDGERRPSGLLLRNAGGNPPGKDGNMEFMRAVICSGAAQIILLTRRGGTDPMPEAGDLDRTRDLGRVLGALGIGITDYIVMADGRYYSFADEVVTPLGKVLKK